MNIQNQHQNFAVYQATRVLLHISSLLVTLPYTILLTGNVIYIYIYQYIINYMLYIIFCILYYIYTLLYYANYP